MRTQPRPVYRAARVFAASFTLSMIYFGFKTDFYGTKNIHTSRPLEDWSLLSKPYIHMESMKSYPHLRHRECAELEADKRMQEHPYQAFDEKATFEDWSKGASQ